MRRRGGAAGEERSVAALEEMEGVIRHPTPADLEASRDLEAPADTERIGAVEMIGGDDRPMRDPMVGGDPDE
jgi:hypothetical protein